MSGRFEYFMLDNLLHDLVREGLLELGVDLNSGDVNAFLRSLVIAVNLEAGDSCIECN